MDIVENINRYLVGSPTSKGERKRLTRARDEIVRLRTTKPAQRTWVGLTKEEVEDIEITWEATSEWSTFGYAVRAIEAKLKEKNT